jgi:S1-C subfamily serine protease
MEVAHIGNKVNPSRIRYRGIMRARRARKVSFDQFRWLAAWILLCCPCVAELSPEVIEQAERAVVRIEVRTSQGSVQGSGFIVDPSGVLITHVTLRTRP